MNFVPDEVLAKPLMAHLATASSEGPRDSPVWFPWEDGVIWLIGSREDVGLHRHELRSLVRHPDDRLLQLKSEN